MAAAAGMLLLLCQAAVAAQPCMSVAPATAKAVFTQPCHEADSQSGNTAGHGVHEAYCPAQCASASIAKLDVVAPSGIPVLTARLDQPLLVACAGPLSVPLTARADSPPLPILHCCLRN